MEAARALQTGFEGVGPQAAEEAALVAELQAGSEEAFDYILGVYKNPIYSLVSHILGSDTDAADVLQNVFVKVFRGIAQFHGNSSLKTWMYRIALHEASNRRRWWFRHKSRETSVDPATAEHSEYPSAALRESMTDHEDSPFDLVAQQEVRLRVENELRKVAEPYRTTVVLRDLEEMSYEEIAEITRVSLGTVKSRLTRGRQALKQRLSSYIREAGPELGLQARPEGREPQDRSPVCCESGEFEVAS